MKLRIFIIIVFVILFAGCTSPQSSPLQADQALTETPPPIESFTNTSPASTLLPASTLPPTNTPGDQIIVLTHETPDLVLTSVNLQLEQNKLELTAAANQINTLQSQSNALKTQLAQASTQAAQNVNSSSSPTSSSSSNYIIPSNVHTVVTTTKALVYITKSNNNAGYPIMEIREPRVKLPPGTLTWVYKSTIRADGGNYFYKSYDPDGKSSETVYLRMQDIQVRLPSGKPDPFKYDPNVAKGEFTQKVVAHYAKSVDSAGKPVMEIYEPRIRYEAGNVELLISEPVTATGGSQWYPIYDPDGKPSLYVQQEYVQFLLIWD